MVKRSAAKHDPQLHFFFTSKQSWRWIGEKRHVMVGNVGGCRDEPNYASCHETDARGIPSTRVSCSTSRRPSPMSTLAKRTRGQHWATREQ